MFKLSFHVGLVALVAACGTTEFASGPAGGKMPPRKPGIQSAGDARPADTPLPAEERDEAPPAAAEIATSQIPPGQSGTATQMISPQDASLEIPASPSDPADSTASPQEEPVDPELPMPAPAMPRTCPETDQHVLVLDFKSGWWAGDGGTFFQTLLRELSDPCIATVSFEYHHIVSGSNTSQVIPGETQTTEMPVLGDVDLTTRHADWGNYSQIWVLSGSSSDNLDLRVTDALFAGLAAKIKASGLPLMVGSGNGNITHANALMTKLGSASRFATRLPEGPVVDATGSFSVLTKLFRGAALSSEHALFQRLSAVDGVADTVETDLTAMRSDYLVVAPDFVNVGRNTAADWSIAASAPGAARRMVLEAGLQRFYAIRAGSNEPTRIYLQNILIFLGTPEMP